jgi:predicted metal-dependent hydrolase
MVSLRNNSFDISFILKHSPRAQGIRLSIHADGRVVLTLPKGVSKERGEAFVESKRAWIEKQLERVRKYEEKNRGKVKLKSSPAEYKKHKESAREFIHARLEYWNSFYNFKYREVRIKNTKSRWGSCSKRGNLNFNYKLALIPERLADYVIVHELCHLKEMNHGPKFWKLVEKAMPDFLERKKELKEKYMHIG